MALLVNVETWYKRSTGRNSVVLYESKPLMFGELAEEVLGQ
jgi:hypothetical protein